MRMTKTERATRTVLANYLRSQGYVTYASLLLKFDLNFYRPAPGEFFAAAMIPGKYTIYINPAVDDKEALSTFIRHEILHEYLKHYDRSLRHLASRAGLNYDELDDLSLNGLKDELEFTHDLQNIAGDYEISNRGYTENDKEVMRNLGKFLGLGDDVKGLVTEDDHPEWVNLPIEDMYDKLLDELDKAKKKVDDAVKEVTKSIPPMSKDDKDTEGDPPPMPPTGGKGDTPPMPPTGGGDTPPGSPDGDTEGEPPSMPPTGGGKPDTDSTDRGTKGTKPSEGTPGDREGDGGSTGGKGDGDSTGEKGDNSSDGPGGKGDPIKRVIHHGTFIDEHTFVDENGNVYDLAHPE